MNESDYRKLKETRWLRGAPPEQERLLNEYFASHPDARADWEADTALSHCIDRLPDVPVPSNFTARVIGQIEREEARRARLKRRHPIAWIRLGWKSRAALFATLAAAAIFGFHQHQVSTRAELAQSVSAVSNVSTLPVEWLQDFEAIHRLSQTPPVDYELIALLE